MGGITEMILDGTLCDECGGIVFEGDAGKTTDEEISPGHPRKCADCKNT